MRSFRLRTPTFDWYSEAKGDQAICQKAEVVTTKTKPPKRYTEGTLLAAMESIDKEIDDPRLKKVMQNKEKAGIGTDATRSSIIEGLFKREYIANDKKWIVPTDKGNSLIQLVERIAPELADPVLTALWEDKLSQIEAGTFELAAFEAELGVWLKTLIQSIRTQAIPRPARAQPSAAQAPQQANGPVYACTECGKPMRLRTGANGAFWGCTGYPNCKNTLPDAQGKPGVRQAQARPAEQGATRVASASPVRRSAAQPAATKAQEPSCTACGKPMRLRSSVRGPFYGCSGYPDCRQTVAIQS